MVRWKMGPLTGIRYTYHSPVRLLWVRHDRHRPWRLHDLSWMNLNHRPDMTTPELWRYYGMQRIINAALNKPLSHVVAMEGLESTPALSDFLTARHYGRPEDNDERLPGSIYICARDGEFGITIKEPTQALMTKLMVPSFKLIIPTLEAYLSGKQPSMWETDPYTRKPAKRKFKA